MGERGKEGRQGRKRGAGFGVTSQTFFFRFHAIRIGYLYRSEIIGPMIWHPSSPRGFPLIFPLSLPLALKLKKLN